MQKFLRFNFIQLHGSWFHRNLENSLDVEFVEYGEKWRIDAFWPP